MFEFIESAAFDRVRPLYLDDEEYGELQQCLMQNPEQVRLFPTPEAYANCVGGEGAQASVAVCA